jgi:hypothetical protein
MQTRAPDNRQDCVYRHVMAMTVAVA